MSIFNEFPYANFHELNLDWVIAQIKKACGDFDELRNLIAEMKKQLNDEYNNIKVYYSNEGWLVFKIRDGYFFTNYIIDTSTVTSIIRNTSDGATVPLYWITPLKSRMLAYPLTDAAITGNVESYLGHITNARIVNKSTFERRLMFFDPAAGPEGSEKTSGVNVLIAGKHAEPPTDPVNIVSSDRFQIVEIADTYYRARTVLGREFAYGANAITYSGSNVINNANGAAMMECDTLVALVMMGIPYSSSPYADDSAGLTFDFNDLVVNPLGYSWPLPWKYNETINRKVTYTGAENWYFWSNNVVFKDPAMATSGDIAIFRRADGKYFDGITHIGIVNKVDNELMLYHVTGSDAVPSPMMYEPLSAVVERGNYTLEDNVYFARPVHG